MMNDCRDTLPEQGDDAQRFAVSGFVALWTQSTPSLSELVDLTTSSAHQPIERLQRAGKLELDPDERLVGVHGLTRRPTRHRIERNGKVNYTWCALDAIGIPAALEIAARAITECLTCGAELRIEVVGGCVGDAPVRLWFPSGRRDHLMNEFCSNANLFCSRSHLKQWVRAAASPAGRVLELQEVAEIGRASWADVATELRGARRAIGSSAEEIAR